MKPTLRWYQSVALVVTLTLCAATAKSAPAAATPDRVGVYDSRAVAYAHFWSASECRIRDAIMAEGKAAKAAGDTERVRALGTQMAAAQERSHQQVFGTAPANEAMAALQEKLPTIQRELGVRRLVSKWDDSALREVPRSQRIDVTDRLVQEFGLEPKRMKTLEELKKSKPAKSSQLRNS